MSTSRLKGFTAVVTPLRNGKGHRYVFTKEHGSAAGAGRTLFLANVDDDGGYLPQELVEKRVRRMLEPFGEVEAVEPGTAHRPDTAAADAVGGGTADAARSYGASAVAAGFARGGLSRARFAHVRFASTKSLKRALSATEMGNGCLPPAGSAESVAEQSKKRSAGKEATKEELPPECRSGLAGALARHWAMRPPRSNLQAEVDSFMEEFDAAEAERQLLEEKRALVDEDGFELVTAGKKRKAGVPAPGVGPAGRKKKGGELQNFYRFQMREAKREQLVQLRRKFEEDKARVARMKEARTFRPF